MRDVICKLIPLTILFFYIPLLVVCDDKAPVPSNKARVEKWFKSNVKSLTERKGTLDPELVKAEANRKVIRVRRDGKGDFNNINDAIECIPNGNTNRVVISIGPGNYNEKIKIGRTKPFITFSAADPKKKAPELVFDGTSAKYGTLDSATLVVESDYFTALNIVFKNSAPRPDGKRVGAQALAMRIGGDKASFYNCRFDGFQDTLCDDKGLHFFKDCHIEGTVDFIFGNGKSIYLNTMLNVIAGDEIAVITAQARHTKDEDTGFSFMHCKVNGTGRIAYLGRSWMPYSRAVFAYTEMSDVVQDQGWSNHRKPGAEKKAYFGEFAGTGPGSTLDKRVGFAKKLTEAEVKPFISLSFIQASKWLLPPATF